MSENNGTKQPSRPTVKRLFAVSGNVCAFAKCSTALVDPRSGSIVGEICHISGEKPGAARYEPNQSNEHRHSFDNLILLCNIHHKIVDDDEATYTIEGLLQMKQNHESRHTSPSLVDGATVERFVAVAISNCTVQGSIVSSHGQTGGQTAHSITNYYNTSHLTTHSYRIATHINTHETVNVSNCERHGRPLAPAWLGTNPERMCSGWLVERLVNHADLQLCFDPKWCGGTWFVVDLQNGDGEVINLDQRNDLMPPSPTTTTAPPQPNIE